MIKKNTKLTFEFASNEMTVEFRLADKKLELPSLSGRLPLLLFKLEPVHSLLMFALAHISLLPLIFLPEDLHFAHQAFSLGLRILCRLVRFRERLPRLYGYDFGETFRLIHLCIIT